MMRLLALGPSALLVLAVLAGAAPPVRAQAPAGAPLAAPPLVGYQSPTPEERFRLWAANAFGPSAMAGDAVSAGWGQWVSGEPEEWPDDRDGYAQRFGAAAATTALTETSLAALAALRGQDPRYHRCPCRGLRPRLAHALRMTFLARRRDGVAVVSGARIVSPFVGPLVTRATMYPERYTLADGALSGAYAVLMNAGWNVAREFVLPAPAW